MKKDGGLSGLVNLGNTCYMNSALQCLFHTDVLTDYILTSRYKSDLNKQNGGVLELLDSYAKLLEVVWEENSVVKPVSFKRVVDRLLPQFRGFQQQDSHEFVVFFLSILHDSLKYQVEMSLEIKSPLVTQLFLERKAFEVFKKHFINNYSFVVEKFYGQLHSKIICNVCNKVSDNFDPFSIISVPLVEKTNSVSLYDCIDLFTGFENLESYRCEKCNSSGNSAVRTVEFWSLPEIMIIHLKRFSDKNKIDTHVDFPLESLKLTKYYKNTDTTSTKNGDTSFTASSKGGTSVGVSGRAGTPVGANSGTGKSKASGPSGGTIVDASSKGVTTSYDFDLFAVSCHSGSKNSGHYWSFIKHKNKWFNFNDSYISKVNTEDIVCTNAYILFYKSKKHK